MLLSIIFPEDIHQAIDFFGFLCFDGREHVSPQAGTRNYRIGRPTLALEATQLLGLYGVNGQKRGSHRAGTQGGSL